MTLKFKQETETYIFFICFPLKLCAIKCKTISLKICKQERNLKFKSLQIKTVQNVRLNTMLVVTLNLNLKYIT